MDRITLTSKIKAVQEERGRRFKAGENIRHFEEELVELKTQLAEMPIETAVIGPPVYVKRVETIRLKPGEPAKKSRKKGKRK